MKRAKSLISGLITASIVMATLLIPGAGVQVEAATSVAIDETNFKDSQLRTYISANIDTNNDGKLSSTELAVKVINCSSMRISSLDGIKNFTKLEELNCADNNISSLDLSSNINLIKLDCSSNKLTELSLIKNTKLKSVHCDFNDLTSIDVSALVNLESLNCTSNELTSLNVSGCPKLTSLYCGTNKLTKLTTTKNPELIVMDCSHNSIQALHVYKSTELDILDCSYNQLTELNVSPLTALTGLNFRSNKIGSIDVSNCQHLKYIYCDNNNLTALDVSKSNSLKRLYCTNNQISSLKLPESSSLQFVNCGHNELASLDISALDSIKELYCDHNKLTKLVMTGITSLEKLVCNDNQLTKLAVKNKTELHALSMFNNKIETVNLTGTSIASDDWGHTDGYIPVNRGLDGYICVSDDFDKIHRRNNDSYTNYPYVSVNDMSVYYSEDLFIADESTTVTGLTIPTVIPTPTPTAAPVTPTPVVTTPAPSSTPATTVAPTGAPVTAVPTNNPVATATPSVGGNPTNSPAAPSSKPTATPSGNISAPTKEPSNPANTDTPAVKPTTGTTSGTSKPSATPGTADTADTPDTPEAVYSVVDFAERLYTTCLGREAEKDGKEFWVAQLKAGMPGSEVAQGFFFSPEFINQNLSNKEFITRLYRTFMGREPDQNGLDYWLGEMKNGQGRVFVFEGFVNSIEWADICLSYGIRSGGLAAPTFEKQPSAEVKAFAVRLYTTCLGRDAEPDGLMYWSSELANLRKTGTVAANGFFFSEEFIKLNLSDEEFVTRLYRTFMDREPEADGFKYWVGELKSGKDRQYVFDGFSVAPEFADLCAVAGIMR